MRQRAGSMWASRPSAVGMRTNLTDDGLQRHRPHGRGGLSPEQEQVLALQRLAGNAAVTRALAEGRGSGRVTSVDAMEITRDGMSPELGVQQIREHTKNKATLALTQRGIVDNAPIMRPEAPEKTRDGGYTTRTRKVSSIPEPMIHEWWPKQGLHQLGKGSYLDVSDTWAKKLEEGEDEHRNDATLAWEKTWKKVQDTINRFAEKPGPAEATPEAAEKALWKRYVAALPKDLQPAGDKPSDARQHEILDVRPGTFMAWMWEITVARDTRMYHETVTGAAPESSRPVPKDAMVSGIAKHPQFLVKGPTSEDFIEEIRKKYTPGKIIQGSKLKDGDATGDVSK
jgi:hypothetical protein